MAVAAVEVSSSSYSSSSAASARDPPLEASARPFGAHQQPLVDPTAGSEPAASFPHTKSSVPVTNTWGFEMMTVIRSSFDSSSSSRAAYTTSPCAHSQVSFSSAQKKSNGAGFASSLA